MPELRAATEADLPRAAALSVRIGWNQVEADWRFFLRAGAVWALDDGAPDGLAATAAVLPFGPDLAWISMVLVRPDRRREGLATALMRWALAELATTRCVALDATPAGREIYRRLGFEDVFGFTRWSMPTAAPRPGAVVPRPIEDADWPALLALDAACFGAPRGPLLRDFARRLPQAAFTLPGRDGFVLARDGLRAPQIGPVVAPDARAALALIGAARSALGLACVIDLADSAVVVAEAIAAQGATVLRPFTRMARGAVPGGLPEQNFVFAGPEFG